MTKLLLTLAFVALLIGCGQWGGLPDPTSKPVSKTDVIGVWSWQASRPMKVNTSTSYSVELEARSDGTYKQKISMAGQTNVVEQTGKWTLDGSQVTFENILHEEFDFKEGVGKWEPRTDSWWMVNAFKKSHPFALFGGLAGDPDSFQEFKKLR